MPSAPISASPRTAAPESRIAANPLRVLLEPHHPRAEAQHTGRQGVGKGIEQIGAVDLVERLAIALRRRRAEGEIGNRFSGLEGLHVKRPAAHRNRIDCRLQPDCAEHLGAVAGNLHPGAAFAQCRCLFEQRDPESGLQAAKASQMGDACDLVIVVGGDGTPPVDRPRASSTATWATRVPLPYQPSAGRPRSS